MDRPIFTIPPDLDRGPASAVLPSAGEINWGMVVLGIEALRKVTRGNGLVMGVVDTGCNQHPDLAGVLMESRSFVGESGRDGNGHGTHVSGTIGATDERIGVGQEFKLYHGQGLSTGGSGGGQQIANAMRWTADKGAEIISMSLGSSGPDPTIQRACDELAGAGIWIVAAAGNSGGGTPDVDFPGRFPSVISVAALDQNLRAASFTNRGAKIDTGGPGVGIWSTSNRGAYQMMSGTSMATPWVAGCLGLYRAALKLKGMRIPSTAEVRQLLMSRSTDVGDDGDDLRTGPGWVNPLLLSLTLKKFPKLG